MSERLRDRNNGEKPQNGEEIRTDFGGVMTMVEWEGSNGVKAVRFEIIHTLGWGESRPLIWDRLNKIPFFKDENDKLIIGDFKLDDYFYYYSMLFELIEEGKVKQHDNSMVQKQIEVLKGHYKVLDEFQIPSKYIRSYGKKCVLLVMNNLLQRMLEAELESRRYLVERATDRKPVKTAQFGSMAVQTEPQQPTPADEEADLGEIVQVIQDREGAASVNPNESQWDTETTEEVIPLTTYKARKRLKWALGGLVAISLCIGSAIMVARRSSCGRTEDALGNTPINAKNSDPIKPPMRSPMKRSPMSPTTPPMKLPMRPVMKSDPMVPMKPPMAPIKPIKPGKGSDVDEAVDSLFKKYE